MDPAVLLQSIVDGVTVGSLYCLAAVSINVMYAPSRVFNFAQGEFVLLGALGSFVFVESLGWLWLAAFVAVIACGALVGAVEEVVAIWPVIRRSQRATAWVLTTLAVSLILGNIVGRYVGDVPAVVRPMPLLSTVPVRVGPVLIQSYQVAIWIFAPLVVAGLAVLLRTKQGSAVLALAEDREAAVLRGIPAARLIFVAWVLGSALALMTGMIAAPITFASVGLGGTLLVKGFETAAIGGLGDNRGAVVGGIFVGVVEALTAIVLSPQFRDIATFLALLLVLSIRPAGLFGRVTIREV